ncbi:hypothetical protein K457DRAFT_25534 [Linnemannia elongata AG-77]|uniref:Uncharacterized protein n=1 Tax=Linnemannia elongata AG-77 TaxID=1314771 RepID=A0A197JEY8_9FUNG|nr:hypothetical protein K457DRAFT_25534 [Linnemannia elongata AG-77]
MQLLRLATAKHLTHVLYTTVTANTDAPTVCFPSSNHQLTGRIDSRPSTSGIESSQPRHLHHLFTPTEAATEDVLDHQQHYSISQGSVVESQRLLLLHSFSTRLALKQEPIVCEHILPGQEVTFTTFAF